MLGELLRQFAGLIPGVHVTRYLSFRLGAAAMTSFALTLFLIPLVIKMSNNWRFGDRDGKSDSDTLNSLHAEKRSTPVLGGLGILAATIATLVLWGSLTNIYVLMCLFIIGSLGACGFVDDYVKTFGKNKHSGLTPKQKLAWQTGTALIFGITLVICQGPQDGLLPKAFAAEHEPKFEVAVTLPGIKLNKSDAALVMQKARSNMIERATVYPPFFKNTKIKLGFSLFVLFCVLVVVGSSNAVNLTDGLDGLAAGCTIFVTIVYAVLSYISGRADWCAYLGIPYVPGVGEVSIVCAALAGSSAGFLWYNCHPAEIFMGDTGSLPLGGSLGAIALMTKHDLLLALAGGIFVAEASSVILQVGVFKLTKNRILRCAPLHHHFEFSGWRETKVVQRFWIIGAFLALAALTTLKLR